MRRALPLVVLIAAGCGGGGEKVASEPRWTGHVLTVTSPAFKADATIPAKHAGEAGVSPLLKWSNVPADTEEFAVIVDDPDEPGTAYWVVHEIPKAATGLPEAVKPDAKALQWPAGTLQGENAWGDPGYRGADAGRRMRFVVYALRQRLSLRPGADVNDLREAISGRVLGRGELVGVSPAGR